MIILVMAKWHLILIGNYLSQVAVTTGFNPTTDATESYVEFLYPQGGLQWIQGAPGPSGLPDVRAQAAIGAEDGRIHVLKGSGTDQVIIIIIINFFR